MTKLKWIFLLVALVATANAVNAQSDDDALRQKIHNAVIRVYDEQLTKEPGDFNTMFLRANQYFNMGQYTEAMNDVNNALNLTPSNDNDLRFEELVLRARIYDAMGNYTSEIADLRGALAINPSALNATDLLAKASLKTGDLATAEQGFQTIQRQSPMNYDALYGMAQVEVKRNNYDAAVAYTDRAVQLFKAEPQVYINRADILEQTHQYDAAAQDLITAISINTEGNDALPRLVSMSDRHYDAVVNALASASDKAPRVGMFYYVRSAIAMNHEHYGQALKDLRSIIDNKLYDFQSVYYNAALCQFNLTQYDDALANVNKAIEMAPSEPDYYILKAAIERYRGRGNNYTTALSCLDAADKASPNYPSSLIARAQMLIAQGNDKQALQYLNAAVQSDASNPDALLLRGWLNKNRLGNTQAANIDFESMLRGADDDYTSLKGFALHELGRDLEARQWIEKITANSLPGGDALFHAAALAGKMGDTAKGMEYLRAALGAGYGNRFEMTVNNDPCVNIAELRADAGFYNLLNDVQTNFQERR